MRHSDNISFFQSPASQSAKTSASLFADCSHTLDNILKIRTESVVDGIMNVWIIKPGSSSRGRGKTHFLYLYQNHVVVTRRNTNLEWRFLFILLVCRYKLLSRLFLYHASFCLFEKVLVVTFVVLMFEMKNIIKGHVNAAWQLEVLFLLLSSKVIRRNVISLI